MGAACGELEARELGDGGSLGEEGVAGLVVGLSVGRDPSMIRLASYTYKRGNRLDTCVGIIGSTIKVSHW